MIISHHTYNVGMKEMRPICSEITVYGRRTGQYKTMSAIGKPMLDPLLQQSVSRKAESLSKALPSLVQDSLPDSCSV